MSAMTGAEMSLTVIWMIVGVAFYQVIVASLTQFYIEASTEAEGLNIKLKALENFQEESQLDQALYVKIK